MYIWNGTTGNIHLYVVCFCSKWCLSQIFLCTIMSLQYEDGRPIWIVIQKLANYSHMGSYVIWLCNSVQLKHILSIHCIITILAATLLIVLFSLHISGILKFVLFYYIMVYFLPTVCLKNVLNFTFEYLIQKSTLLIIFGIQKILNYAHDFCKFSTSPENCHYMTL